jgi:hypothetical protein
VLNLVVPAAVYRHTRCLSFAFAVFLASGHLVAAQQPMAEGFVIGQPKIPYYLPTLQNFQASAQNNDLVQLKRMLAEKP